MNFEEDPKFKALRHRFYRLAKHGPGILQEMGFLKDLPEGAPIDHETTRPILFEIVSQGKMADLEKAINGKEAEILEQIGHKGDPCIYCSIPHDEVKPGPCPVRKRQVQP